MVPTFYYVLGIPFFCLMGIGMHLFLRLAFSRTIGGSLGRLLDLYVLFDDFISHEHGLLYTLFGLTSTDHGTYDLYSLKNIRVCCQVTVALGMCALVFIPGAIGLFRTMADGLGGWIWQLFLFRLANLKLI